MKYFDFLNIDVKEKQIIIKPKPYEKIFKDQVKEFGSTSIIKKINSLASLDSSIEYSDEN